MTGPRSLAQTLRFLLSLGAAALAPAAAHAQCASTGEFLDEPTGRMVRLDLTVDSPGPQARAFNEDCDRLPIRGTVTPTAIPEPVDVILVIDVSTSAFDCSGADVDGDGITAPATHGVYHCTADPDDTIAHAEVAAARVLVDRMASTDSRFAVIRYGTSAERVLGLTAAIDTVNAGLDRVPLDGLGSTNYFRALELAEQIFRTEGLPGRSRLVLFLSDGEPTSPSVVQPRFGAADCSPFAAGEYGLGPACNAILMTEALYDQGVRLDSFAVGTGATWTVLEQMAEAGGGKFYDVPDPGDVDDTFGELLVGIQSLRVENLTTGEVVDVPSPRNGAFEVRIDPAAGTNELLVSAFASRPAGARLDCSTSFEFACLEATCPADQVLTCEGDLAATTLGFEASASDAAVVIVNDSPHADLQPGSADADGAYPLGLTEVGFVFSHAWSDDYACTRSVLVEDLEPPILEQPPPFLHPACDEVQAPFVLSLFDACDPAPNLDYEQQRVDGPCADQYHLNRTWTAEDVSGQSTVVSQVIEVMDLTPPELEGVPEHLEVECGSVPSPPEVQAADTCDPDPALAFHEQRLNGDCPGSYRLRRTWTAVDRCGNSSVGLQIIDVEDGTPPVLAGVPADRVVSCAAVPPPALPTAIDSCDPHPELVFEETTEEGDCPDRRVLVRTWTATDSCGNATEEVQRIEVVDDTPPTLSGVPADAVVSCDAVPEPATPNAVDDCDGSPQVAFEETTEPGPCPDRRVLVRTWTATDRCGNASLAVQRLEVVDDEAPALEGVPADAVVACHAVPEPARPTAVDACDPAPRVELEERVEPGSCADRYRLVRTWTATDRCGNASVAVQRLEVVDEQAPELIGVPADRVVECPEVGPPPAVRAVDACDPEPEVSFSETTIPGDCPGRWTVLREWTATDRCGLSSSARQVIEVVDTTPPLVTPSTETIACLWPPNHWRVGFSLEDFAPRAVDACSEPIDWRLSHCLSSQPDDANGDGRTEDDCVISEDGRSVLVRAERRGDGPDAGEGRTYTLLAIATDACGNSAEPAAIGSVLVPHDARSGVGACLAPHEVGCPPRGACRER